MFNDSDIQIKFQKLKDFAAIKGNTLEFVVAYRQFLGCPKTKKIPFPKEEMMRKYRKIIEKKLPKDKRINAQRYIFTDSRDWTIFLKKKFKDSILKKPQSSELDSYCILARTPKGVLMKEKYSCRREKMMPRFKFRLKTIIMAAAGDRELGLQALVGTMGRRGSLRPICGEEKCINFMHYKLDGTCIRNVEKYYDHTYIFFFINSKCQEVRRKMA
jgi:hypothetical protein